MSRYDEGYAITDRYDLGQSTPIKYGTNIQMINAVKALHKVGISAQVDLVMNQMLGLSGKEVVTGTRTNSHGQQITVGGRHLPISYMLLTLMVAVKTNNNMVVLILIT